MADEQQIVTAPAPTALEKQIGFKHLSLKELPPEQVEVLRNTVAKGATDAEMEYFLNLAFAQELNPFIREVWCIKRAKKQQINGNWDYKRNPDGSINYDDADLIVTTSRDGFLKMAKRDPRFDRIISAEVRANDHFIMNPITGDIEHHFSAANRGAIVGAYAVIVTKKGDKISKYVTFSEYNDEKSGTWKEYPAAMICKTAESVLCKQFAGISGLVAEEAIIRDGADITSSVGAEKESSKLKNQMIVMIDKCKTPDDFKKAKESLTRDLSKLFENERKEVMEYLKKRFASVSNDTVIDAKVEDKTKEQPKNEDVQDAEVIEDKPVEEQEQEEQVQQEETAAAEAEASPEEMDELSEALKAHDTAAGLNDLWNDVIMKTPMSSTQRDTLRKQYEMCFREVSGKKVKAKK